MDRNELDPSVPSAMEVKKIPSSLRCTPSYASCPAWHAPSVGAFMWQVITALINGNAAANSATTRSSRSALSSPASCSLQAPSSDHLWPGPYQNQRRNAARLSYILMHSPSSSFWLT
ncbi:MAG: hypothetical protein ACLU37_05735 [Collinsella sp.]